MRTSCFGHANPLKQFDFNTVTLLSVVLVETLVLIFNTFSSFAGSGVIQVETLVIPLSFLVNKGGSDANICTFKMKVLAIGLKLLVTFSIAMR